MSHLSHLLDRSQLLSQICCMWYIWLLRPTQPVSPHPVWPSLWGLTNVVWHGAGHYLGGCDLQRWRAIQAEIWLQSNLFDETRHLRHHGLNVENCYGATDTELREIVFLGQKRPQNTPQLQTNLQVTEALASIKPGLGWQPMRTADRASREVWGPMRGSLAGDCWWRAEGGGGASDSGGRRAEWWGAPAKKLELQADSRQWVEQPADLRQGATFHYFEIL